MKIFIAGGTGFVGMHLAEALNAAGYDITMLVRTAEKKRLLPHGVTIIDGDPTKKGDWQRQVGKAEVLINLTGRNIFSRWTASAKHLIHTTRIIATRNIVEAIGSESGSKTTLINASASGYYGFGGDEEKFENAPPGSDFLAGVCQDWEKEARKAESKGVRVISTRLGVVLGKNGGALAKMLPAFRLGLGGRLGHGRQWFPWVHITDLCRAMVFIMEDQDISGPVNLCTPHPVRNRELTATLAGIIHRPALLPLPRFLPQLLLGDLTGVLFEGNRMMPGVLAKAGFTFRFPKIKKGLSNLLDNV